MVSQKMFSEVVSLMGTFHIRYDYVQLSKMKDTKCRLCKVEFKEGDEGIRINGAHTKHYHKECYKRAYH